MKQPIFNLLSITSIIFSTTTVIFAQPGTLDASFGIGGIVSTDIGTADDKGYSVIQQTDGKLVVAGFSNNLSNNDFAVTRYNADGSLDLTFDTDGIVTTAIGSGNESGQSVVLQTDGKILVAGFSNNGTNNDFAITRYNTDGSLDLTFDTDGIVTTAIGSSVDQSHSIALQTDGKIVVAGFSNGANTDFAVARYNTNGSLDVTFDTDGIVTTDFSSTDDTGRSVAIQSDGKIVVGGWSFSSGTNDFALVRYNTDGSLDLTFDTDGKVTTPIGLFGDQGYSIALQSDGKILLSGISGNATNLDFATVRYNTNGSLDNTFDTDGIVVTDFFNGDDYGYSVVQQADGKILLGGQCINGTNNDFGLVRYNSNGSLDITFDTDGIVTTDLGSNSDVGWSVAIQADDRVVVAGSNSISGAAFGVVRYNTCELIDTSMTQFGLSLTANSPGTYQWVNCDSSYAPMVGEINQTYNVMANGSYAVIITMDNCMDTSGCYTFSTVGIAETNFAYLATVYPNPTNGQLMLVLNTPINNATIRLTNLTGQTIFQKSKLNGNSFIFDISDQKNGIYIVEINDGTNIARSKVVKK